MTPNNHYSPDCPKMEGSGIKKVRNPSFSWGLFTFHFWTEIYVRKRNFFVWYLDVVRIPNRLKMGQKCPRTDVQSTSEIRTFRFQSTPKAERSIVRLYIVRISVVRALAYRSNVRILAFYSINSARTTENDQNPNVRTTMFSFRT